jgi:hypothetical protein
LAAVAISGDYNDLTNKPTVPTISTNIANDAISDTKTTSPKAVKDFVEGKGYLTQHQDISGKADQTDLEALEDRVDVLEQGGSGGGDTTQYSYLKLIPDLDAYLNTAQVGELVMYSGATNAKYTKGWIYEKVSDGGSAIEPYTINVPANKGYITNDIGSKTGPFYPTGNSLHLILYYKNNKTCYAGCSLTTRQAVGDTVFTVTQTGAGSRPFTVTGTATITNISGSETYFSNGKYADSSSRGSETDLFEFANTKGELFYVYSLNSSALDTAGTSNKEIYTPVYDSYDNNVSVQIALTQESMTITIGGETTHWEPVLMSTASN